MSNAFSSFPEEEIDLLPSQCWRERRREFSRGSAGRGLHARVVTPLLISFDCGNLGCAPERAHDVEGGATRNSDGLGKG